ncbi:MAG TPA: HNH endonuclease signature motif containing protein [Bacteriovoracaceae bacterium]|nr:HNH endonuclease signature motif containing protein [Bacteriovoracaceae bacterium]
MKLVRSVPEMEEKIESGVMSLCNASILLGHMQNNHIKPDSAEAKKCMEQAEALSSRKLRQEFKPELVVEKKIVLHGRILKKLKKLQEIWSDVPELEIFEALIDEKIRQIEFNKTTRNTKADPSKRSRYIPVSTKREILERSSHRCEHTFLNGKRCEERRFLEFDHVTPYALGGDRSLSNLRVLCRNHNQWKAQKTFGGDKVGLQGLPSFK